MEDWQKYLKSINHDPSHPGSFTGPETLYKVVLAEGKFKIGRHRIRKWLQDQESYSVTRGVRRKYNRSRVIVSGINSQANMDLGYGGSRQTKRRLSIPFSVYQYI